MTESSGINTVGKGQRSGHEDSGVFESPSANVSPVTTVPEHTRTPPSSGHMIPDRASPRETLTFSFHGYAPRSSTHDTTRSAMGQHSVLSTDADRSFEGDVNILFEDSGSYCPSIPEDSEEEEEEDPGYQRPKFEIPSSPTLSSGDFNSYVTQPMSIPTAQGRSFDRCSTGADTSASSESRHGRDNVTSSTNNTPSNHCTHVNGQGKPHTPRCSGGLSLSPVIESMLLQKMRNRLSGDFEERSLRVSGCLLANENNESDFRERASSVSGQPPDVQVVRAARMSRGRSQSAPTVEAKLLVQRQQVGGALRIFGDQFNREYERRAPNRSPSQRQCLRRQVLSCPTQHSLWQQMLLEKSP